MRTLNLRFAIGLSLVVTLCGVGVFALHSYQARRISKDILEQAHEARSRGQDDDAVKLAYEYLAFQPNDAAMLEELSSWLESKAVGRRQLAHAAAFLDKALQLKPDRNDLRRKLTGLYVRTGNWSGCLGHLELLRAATADDPDLLRQLGVCQEAIGKYNEAAESLEKSVRLDPKQATAALDYASLLLRHLSRPDDARRVLESATHHNPENADVRLGLARYFRTIGKYPEAEAAAREAIRLAPSNVTALTMAAEICQLANRRSAANELLQRAHEIQPKNAQLACSLSWHLACDGKTDQAIEKLEKTLKENPGNTDVLTLLGDLLALDGKVDALERIVGELESLRRTAPERGWNADYLRARLLMRRGDWPAAALCLDKLRLSSARNPGLAKQSNYLLAKCYEELRNQPAELEAYRRIFDADANAGYFRLEYSRALARAKQCSDAVKEFRQAVLRPEVPVRLVLDVLNELSERCGRAGPDAVRELQQAMDAIRVEDAPAHAVVAKIECMRLLGRRTGEALKLADRFLAKQPNSLAFQLARVRLLDDLMGPERSSAALAELENRFGDSADIRVTRIRLSAPRLPADQARKLLEETTRLDSLSSEDRYRVMSEVITALGQIGDEASLGQALELLRGTRVDDLHSRSVLLTRALRRGDEDGIQNLLSEIARIEGTDGLVRRLFDAERLVAARSPNADGKLVELEKVIPGHPRVAFLRARFAETIGQTDIAKSHYRMAWDNGLFDLPVEEQFSSIAKADATNRMCRVLVEESGLFERLRLSSDRGILREMLPLAPASARSGFVDQVVRANPNASPAQLVWLGRLCQDLGLTRHADASLMRATQLAPLSDEAWVARIGFHAAKRDLAAVNMLVTQAKKSLPPEGGVVLAKWLESAGLEADTVREIRSAVHREPAKAVASNRKSIESLLASGQLTQARSQLQDMVARNPGKDADANWYRRMLAFNLTLTPSLAAYQESLRLLDANDASVEDQRVRAVVMSAQRIRPFKDTTARREAIRILRALDSRKAASADDLLLLTKDLIAEGDSAGALQMMQRIEREHGNSYAVVEFLCRNALRRGDSTAAQRFVSQLEKIDASRLETLAHRFAVMVMAGKTEPAIQTLEQYMSRGGNDAMCRGRCRRIAEDVLVSFPIPADAAMRIREAAIHWSSQGVGNDPQALLNLVTQYGRMGRIDAALELLLTPEVRGKFSPETQAAAASAALRSGQPTAEQIQAVERMIAAQRRQKPDSIPLELAQAELFEKTQRYAEAEVAYRRVLERDAGNVIALNNLAWTYSYDPTKMGDAPRLIQDAIDRAGPLDELIDTRARVLFAIGRHDEAIRDQRELTATAPTGARWFGLAVMLRDQNNLAAEALREAKRFGLTAGDLHPRDEATFRSLVARN